MKTGIRLASAGALAMITALAYSAQGKEEPAGKPHTKARVTSAPLYPRRWDVSAPPGTQLAALKAKFARATLPPKDLEDHAPLPPWFRAYLRAQFPALPKSGAYQYPHEALTALDWMVGHPNLIPPPALAQSLGRSPLAGNVSLGDAYPSCGQWDSESVIAADPMNASILMAASNAYDGTGSAGQRQYFSSDGAKTWARSMLPRHHPAVTSGDPTLAYALDETAWSATLGLTVASSDPWQLGFGIQLYRSQDRGASWEFCRQITAWAANDKEMMWIDTDSASPFKDRVFFVWTHLSLPEAVPDVPGVFTASIPNSGPNSCDPAPTLPPLPYPSATRLSEKVAIGAHLASGPTRLGPPPYKLYVAWPETGTETNGVSQLRINSSADGEHFGTATTIAPTRGKYQFDIPAMHERDALIYLSLAVDRSSSSSRGNVYAAWTDCKGPVATHVENQQTISTCTQGTNVYFSFSQSDGQSWSDPTAVEEKPTTGDRFGQSMDVDQRNGTIHVSYYQTTDAARTRTRLHHLISEDGGQHWTQDHEIATADTDETAAAADHRMQYGDYNGLAVSTNGMAYPSWTDRRPDAAGRETQEQIYTAAVSTPPSIADILKRGPCGIPETCRQPKWLDRGVSVIRCLHEGCKIVEPLVTYCPHCPKCDLRPRQQCPVTYKLNIEGLRGDWQVDVVDADEQPVQVKRRDVEATLELSVEFDPKELASKDLDAYVLRFTPRSAAVIGKEYRLKSSMEPVEAASPR